MLTTGYEVREAIKRWILRREAADKSFRDSLWKFADESKSTPLEISERYAASDKAIAVLEDIQQTFNSATVVKVGTETMTLSMAVKSVGGIGRLEKMWRSAVSDTGAGRWREEIETTRKADEIKAKKQVSVETAMERADYYARLAGQLRAAIANGNSSKFEVVDGSEAANFLTG